MIELQVPTTFIYSIGSSPSWLLPLKYVVPVILILAFQYVFVKDSLNYTSPILFETMFVAIMAVVFSVACGFKYVLNRGMIPFLLGFWLSGICWVVGLSYVSASESAILSFTMPLFSIPLAVVVLRERSASTDLVGTLVGFSGITLYNIPLITGGYTLLGVLLTLGNGFFWAMYTVYGRKLSSQDTIQTLATASVLTAFLDAFLSVFYFKLRPTANLAVDLGYQGFLGGSLSIFLWLRLLKLEKTSKVTTLTFIAPVITLAYGVVTTGVLPAVLSVVGVALIFLGIFIANVMGRAREEPPLGASTSPSISPGVAQG